MAQSWEARGEANITRGGHITRGQVSVRYPGEGAPRRVPVLKPWDRPNPDRPELGPIRLPDSDLFLRCAVRHLSEQVRELFGLSTLTGPGYEFFTDCVTWHRVEGKICIGPSPFEAPVLGK